MNEDLKRALKEVGRYWHVCGHSLADSGEERYWEMIWPAIERWHEGQVDALLEDNQRLREEVAALKAIKEDDYKEIEALREKLTGAREEIAAMRKANADHQQQVASAEGEVGRLTWERDGARGDRDTALEDNQRLREEIDSMKAALRARDAVIARLEDEAHAEPEEPAPNTHIELLRVASSGEITVQVANIRRITMPGNPYTIRVPMAPTGDAP